VPELSLEPSRKRGRSSGRSQHRPFIFGLGGIGVLAAVDTEDSPSCSYSINGARIDIPSAIISDRFAGTPQDFQQALRGKVSSLSASR